MSALDGVSQMSAVAQSRPIVLFLHIPKTAGTTLNKVVYANYDLRAVSNEKPEEQSWENQLLLFAPDGIYHVRGGFHGAISDADIDSIRRQIDPDKAKVILGHFSFGLHGIFARPSTYVTFLRDPIDRVVSLYHHCVRFQNDDFGVLSRRLSLGEFASQPGAANDQVRRLSGLEPGSTQQSSVIQQAKMNLRKHFSFVGITERFDEAVLLLSRTLGWRRIHYRPKLVNQEKPDKVALPPQVLETVAKANSLDMELFEYARELFDDRVKREGAGFQRELEEFRQENQRYIEALTGKRIGDHTATRRQRTGPEKSQPSS